MFDHFSDLGSKGFSTVSQCAQHCSYRVVKGLMQHFDSVFVPVEIEQPIRLPVDIGIIVNLLYLRH